MTKVFYYYSLNLVSYTKQKRKVFTMSEKREKNLLAMAGIVIRKDKKLPPDKRWVGNRVKFQMLGPLDPLETAASVMLNHRIDGICIPELKQNIDITLSLVEHLPYDGSTGDRTVESFRFEGRETTTVDGFVRGEFDTIRKTGWIELKRTMPKVQKKQ